MSTQLQERFQAIAAAKLRLVLGQREEILTAFIAKYGFEPERAIQIEQRMADGTSRWYVRRRTDEEMAELSRSSSSL